MKLLALVSSLLAAACGSSAPAVTTPASSTPAGPPYAALLVDGARWTVTGTAKTTPPVDMGPPSEATLAPFTCTVGGAHAMGATRMATITCDGEAGATAPPMAGTWVATDAGLWWFQDAAAAHAAAMAGPLPVADMLIAAVPVAGERTQQVDETESRHHAVTQKAGAWCTAFSVAAGDEGGFELCFPPGGGLTGTAFSAGATAYDLAVTATTAAR